MSEKKENKESNKNTSQVKANRTPQGKGAVNHRPRVLRGQYQKSRAFDCQGLYLRNSRKCDEEHDNKPSKTDIREE